MENLIRGFDEHSIFLSAQEVADELKSLGSNREKTVQHTKTLIASSLKKERTAWMRVADANRHSLESAFRATASWGSRTKEEILAAYEALKSGLTGEQAIAFRNQEDLSTEDMAKILDDFERVRQIKEPPQL